MTDALVPIPRSGAPNADVAAVAAPYPTIPRIADSQPINETNANQQPKMLEKRTDTLLDKTNELVAGYNSLLTSVVNAIKRDGTTTITNNINMNGYTIFNVPNALAQSSPVPLSQLRQIIPANFNINNYATKQYVQDAIATAMNPP